MSFPADLQGDAGRGARGAGVEADVLRGDVAVDGRSVDVDDVQLLQQAGDRPRGLERAREGGNPHRRGFFGRPRHADDRVLAAGRQRGEVLLGEQRRAQLLRQLAERAELRLRHFFAADHHQVVHEVPARAVGLDKGVQLGHPAGVVDDTAGDLAAGRVDRGLAGRPLEYDEGGAGATRVGPVGLAGDRDPALGVDRVDRDAERRVFRRDRDGDVVEGRRRRALRIGFELQVVGAVLLSVQNRARIALAADAHRRSSRAPDHAPAVAHVRIGAGHRRRAPQPGLDPARRGRIFAGVGQQVDAGEPDSAPRGRHPVAVGGADQQPVGAGDEAVAAAQADFLAALTGEPEGALDPFAVDRDPDPGARARLDADHDRTDLGSQAQGLDSELVPGLASSLRRAGRQCRHGDAADRDDEDERQPRRLCPETHAHHRLRYR